MKSRFLIAPLLLCVVFASSCAVIDATFGTVSNLIGASDTATVIAKTAQIRTSYSVVAADLLEVKRGDTLDILDQVEYEKVPWYRVRARDEAQTEGWIEAQNVITSDTLERSKKLAESFANQTPQASGIIRSASNLRAAPDMTPENVLFKLANGSTFDIMSWKFVPKQEAPDVDDAPRGQQKTVRRSKSEELEAAKEAGEPDKLEDKYDIWYQVRLDRSVSPAPAGWLFGRQVELQVPSDIVFFQQNNKKFVTWQRLDTENVDKAVTRGSTPGSWVVLTRTNQVKAVDGVEPDFDGILVLAFDKYKQTYYTVWRTPNYHEVWGTLPLKVEGKGDNKTFTVNLRGPSGSMDAKTFTLFRERGNLRATPPEDIAQYQQKSKIP
jgi:hypothetical protein